MQLAAPKKSSKGQLASSQKTKNVVISGRSLLLETAHVLKNKVNLPTIGVDKHPHEWGHGGPGAYTTASIRATEDDLYIGAE